MDNLGIKLFTDHIVRGWNFFRRIAKNRLTKIQVVLIVGGLKRRVVMPSSLVTDYLIRTGGEAPRVPDWRISLDRFLRRLNRGSKFFFGKG